MKPPSRRTLALPLWLAASVLTSAEPREIHLAPHGNDQATGTSQAPLASLAAARDAVRRLRAETAQPPGAIHVIIADGHYALPQPLLLGPEDGGTCENTSVHYRAAPGAKPVFEAGLQVSPWTVLPDGTWTCPLPAAASASIEALWVNGRRATRARFPNHGEATLEAVRETILDAGEGRRPQRARQHLQIPADAFAKLADLTPEQLAAVDLVLYHKWDVTRRRPLSLDPETRTVTVEGGGMKPWNRLEKDTPFLLENLPNSCDQPGEWVRETNSLIRYRPLPGESAESCEAFVPVSGRFLDIRGDAAAQRPVTHLTFHGLTFRHAQAPLTPAECEPAQSASQTAAVIHVHDASHIRFENCSIRHTGSWGLWFQGASRDCTVQDCHFDDLGAGAIRIGEAVTPLVSHITIHNNRLTRGGRVNASAAGLLLTHAADCRITHNEIADFFYTGISLGWIWGYSESPSRRNLVSHNHVHTLGQGVLSDMGGIYTLGNAPGTVITHNVFHDIQSRGYGGWGLYTDEGSSGILMENNLVFRTKTGGFHQHYGRENIIRNNIFALGREQQVQATRVEDHLSFTFERNILWWDHAAPVLAGPWETIRHVSRRNTYWNAGDHPVSFLGKSLAEWQAAGHETESILADPRFADPAQGDFSLPPDSPALATGFQPFDFRTAGPLRGNP
jgi:hypothetical protein